MNVQYGGDHFMSKRRIEEIQELRDLPIGLALSGRSILLRRRYRRYNT